MDLPKHAVEARNGTNVQLHRQSLAHSYTQEREEGKKTKKKTTKKKTQPGSCSNLCDLL